MFFGSISRRFLNDESHLYLPFINVVFLVTRSSSYGDQVIFHISIETHHSASGGMGGGKRVVICVCEGEGILIFHKAILLLYWSWLGGHWFSRCTLERAKKICDCIYALFYDDDEICLPFTSMPVLKFKIFSVLFLLLLSSLRLPTSISCYYPP